jgi:actin related protein 2/3 complex subunit 5
MASGASTSNPSKNVTPQVTGFSQVQPRNTAESQGGNMGVFLSWHEKVKPLTWPSHDIPY